MEQDRTFVITALQSWSSDQPSNAQSMALEISKYHKVLYVNPPLDMLSLLNGFNSSNIEHKSRVIRGSEHAIRHINKNLWVLEPPIMISQATKIYSDVVFDLLNKRNNRRYAQIIKWALDYLNLNEIYLIIDNDIFRCFYLSDYLEPLLTIYYRRDNLLSLPYWRHHGLRLEPELVRKSDIVITSNEPLAEDIRNNNFNTFSIGQGVDMGSYNLSTTYSLPRDMKHIPHPIIGFEGLLGVLYHSPNMFYNIAKSLPNCSIVLVGGEDEVFTRHTLHELGNVYFLGEKQGHELASYVSHFDICINPEVRNELTASNYNKKVAQWLSLGKTIVATATTPMQMFVGNIMLANNDSHFLSLVGSALLTAPSIKTQMRRYDFAHSLTWTSCIDRLYTVIDLVNEQQDYDSEEEFNMQEMFS